MSLEGFDTSIAGKWVLVKNENFDEFLKAMGVGLIKRKVATGVTPTIELLREGENKVRIITKKPKDTDRTVTLDEEYEETDPFDNKVKAKVTWDSATCVLTTTVNPVKPDGKRSTVTRKIVGDQLVTQMELHTDGIICKRIFKKADS